MTISINRFVFNDDNGAEYKYHIHRDFTAPLKTFTS
jgi:hypothetical protein